MSVRCTCAADPELAPRDHSPSCVSRLQAEVDPDAFGAAGYLLRPPGPAAMSPEQAEVLQAFATLRRHLPASLRMAEAELEAAWFNGGPLPIDWPARFQAAAEAVPDCFPGTERDLRRLEQQLRALVLVRLDVVEAIGRALLGEES